MDRFVLVIAPTLHDLTELLNKEQETSYYTICDIRAYGTGYAALIDRMPVELVTLNSYAQDVAYTSADMA